MSSASADIEGRWPIPPGWNWRRAKDFAKVVGGGTPKNAKDPANYAEDGTPWITPADLSGYSQPTIGRGARSLSETGFGGSSAKLLPAGTVLVSSRAPVGYCAVASNDVSTNQGFRSLVLDGLVDPFFLRYYVLASRGYLEDNASGTTFKELPGKVLEQLLFPIPPMETQKRIVARIDELFTELDDGEDALARAREDLETYRKSLLKAAVTGELTADWRAANPPQETGEQLLKRILADRKARWEADPKNRGKRYKEPTPPSVDVVPSIPDGWAWASADMLSNAGKGHIVIGPFGSNLKVADYRDEGVPLVFVRHIRSGDFEGQKPQFVSEEKARELASHQTQSGDVLITKMGDPPGDAAVYPEDLPDAVITADCIRWRVSGDAMASYCAAWVNSQAGRAWIQSKTKGVAQQKISLEIFRSMPVAVPPLEEQAEIMKNIESLQSSASIFSEELTFLSDRSLLGRQAILASAFKGELIQ